MNPYVGCAIVGACAGFSTAVAVTSTKKRKLANVYLDHMKNLAKEMGVDISDIVKPA